MKTRLILSGTAAILCAGALSSAQIPPQGGAQQRPPQPTTQTQPRATPSGERVTTLAGCLYREEDIPGRTPNVAERAGILEDYILADATMATAPGAGVGAGVAQPGQKPSTGATAGLATGRMYKVSSLADDRLRPLVGKRVEVTGTVEASDDRPGAAAGERGRGLGDLPDIEATSIREVAGATCPPKPAASSPTTPAPSPNR